MSHSSASSERARRLAAGGVLLALAVAAAVMAPGAAWARALAALLLGFLGAWALRLPRDTGAEGRLEVVAARLARLAGRPDGAASRAPLQDLDAIESQLDGGARREAEHRRRLAALFDGVDAPIVATDEHGEVTLCNRSAGALVGTAPERLVGRPVDQVFTQSDLLRLHAAARAGRAGQERVRLTRADGVWVFEASAVPVTWAAEAPAPPAGPDHGYPVVMTLRDVTELSRAVQVKSDFVANASHELRTPIATLRMAAETLQSDAADDPAMRGRLIGVVEANTGRLEEMVRDLMDLSRLESPEVPPRIGPVAASDVRDTLASMFEPVCRERSLTLAFDLAPELERMRTDRELLLLILKNLVENATRFAYEATEVRVVGRVVDAASDAGSPGPARPPGVRFDVIDRGIGIPLSQQQRIFERFYQVDPARTGGSPRRGSGLGLAIVKHAVRTLGGVIRVHSVWKAGTTMSVELPGAVGAAE